MSDTPYREPCESTGVCPRCAERDARNDAVAAWLSRAATYALRAALAAVMLAHWFIANDVIAHEFGHVSAVVVATISFGMMIGVFCGTVIRDRSFALFFLATWAIVVSSPWAIVSWRMQ